MEKVMQVFLCRSVEFSNQYRPVSKLPFRTQVFFVSCVNVCSTSRASPRLWLCSPGVIKFLVLGLAQRSGELDAYSAKSCSWSFSTIGVELFIAQKNWAQGMQSHLISWFFSLRPSPQCFQLWVWSRVWIWLRKNYLFSLIRHWVFGRRGWWCLVLTSGRTPRSCGRVILLSPLPPSGHPCLSVLTTYLCLSLPFSLLFLILPSTASGCSIFLLLPPSCRERCN